MRESLRKWQSPPDPSTNHNIACSLQHEGTAEWFCDGNTFEEWKVDGSLLWIHGKRMIIFSFDCSGDHLTDRMLRSWLWKERSMVSSLVLAALSI